MPQKKKYPSLESVFRTAHDKYNERSSQYEADDPWGNGGWRAQLVEMRKKLDRLWTHWDSDSDEQIMLAEDDAIDLICYAAFFLILMEKGDRDGSWPWPKDD
jgi:hypothetical protein